jgi:hypothetical protein
MVLVLSEAKLMELPETGVNTQSKVIHCNTNTVSLPPQPLLPHTARYNKENSKQIFLVKE